MFDQHAPQNSLQSIVPDLATDWSWSEEGTELTLLLREGVTWHDGKQFTARDVVCTFDLLTGKSSDKLRVNPRKSWYRNLERLTTNGDYETASSIRSSRTCRRPSWRLFPESSTCSGHAP
jgi:peptide/nickel transport system substrate-binding protein